MIRRTAFGQTSTNVQNQIFQNYSRMDRLQRQLASGRKLARPSDDPVGVSNALDVRTMLSQNSQYQRNVDGGTAYLATIDTTIGGNNEILQHARELGIQGANDTLTAQNRSFIGREVRSLVDQMVSVANTSFRGEYVFSGTNTQLPPYDVRNGNATIDGTVLTLATLGTPIQIVDRNVTDSATPTGMADAYHVIPGTFTIAGLTEGADYTVDYVNGTVTFTPPGAAALALAGGAGIQAGFTWIRRNEANLDGVIKREIGQDNAARINTTASDVFGATKTENSFAAMITLLDGLVNNKGNAIRQSLGDLDTSLSRNLEAQAQTGARANQYALAQDREQVKAVDLTDIQSKLEDVDFAEAVSQLAMQQAVYDASLQMGARSIQKTLMDFL